MQIVGFWFTVGESTEELDDLLQDVAKRFHMHGFEGPLLFFTDNCCKERNFLKKVKYSAMWFFDIKSMYRITVLMI